jgi:hypothetical protein
MLKIRAVIVALTLEALLQVANTFATNYTYDCVNGDRAENDTCQCQIGELWWSDIEH